MMAHLGGQKVEVPELLFAPECVEMAELRKKWDAIAALATEEGAPEITAPSLRGARPALQDITARIPTGSLTMLVGPVGSGKTSLLSAIMGEITKLGGTVEVRGSVAYTAQNAFIQNDTVEGNILFGKDMDEDTYASRSTCVPGCATAIALAVVLTPAAL